MIRHGRRNLIRQREGTTTIEFGIIFLLMMLLIAGIIDFGRYLWFRSALQDVAADTARCAALYTANQAYYTTQPYNLTPDQITSPCSSVNTTLHTSTLNVATYATSIAQSRGITLTTSVDNTSGAAAACSVTYSNPSPNPTYYLLKLNMTYVPLLGGILSEQSAFTSVSTTVCFPY